LTPTEIEQPAIQAPEQVEGPPAPQQEDFGKNNRSLPDQLKNAILEAIKEAQRQERYQRRQEILQDSMHRFYDMGIQHIYMNAQFGFNQAAPGGTYPVPGAGTEAFGEYIDDYNIFQPFALIQQAKLSENMPGIDFQPVDPNDPDDIEAANAAEGMRHDFDRNNDIKEIQKSIIYHLQMGGRAVMWTRMEDENEDFDDEGEKRKTTATVYGCIEAKVPIFANRQEDFWYTIVYDDPDIKAAKTKYPWIADKLAAGRVCLEENAYERIARLGVIQGSQGSRYGFRIGDSISHLITRGNCFLRLSAFEAMKDSYTGPDGQSETVPDTEGAPGSERPIQVNEKLAQIYPNGVHACILGDQYAESWNISMDDCIKVASAYVGKGQSRMPMMKSMVVVQDRFNSSMNYIAETNDYCVPSTWVSCDAQEFAAIRKQKASPGSFRNLKQLPQGITSIAQAVYSETGRDIPKSFQEYLEFLYSTLPQFQLAVPPSIWGEAMKDQKTASGYQLAASQAMGILGVYWMVETKMLAAMYYHNCLAIKNEPRYPDEITVPAPSNGRSSGRNMTVRKASLTKGNFRAFPDTESGFPETTSAKRNTLTGVGTQLAASPLAAQIFGSPDNVAFMLREYGLTELVIPEAEARNKQLREIETLLAQPPMLSQPLAAMMAEGAGVQSILDAIKTQAAEAEQQQQIQQAAQTIAATAQGTAPPPPPTPVDPTTLARSSVPVWDSDYHIWEAKKCRDWLSSDERNTEETIGRPSADPADQGALKPNIAGILNVVLHKLEHDAKAALEAPPISGPLPAPTMGGLPKPGLMPPPAAPGAPMPAPGM
jgi:regulator of replication initiation timing